MEMQSFDKIGKSHTSTVKDSTNKDNEKKNSSKYISTNDDDNDIRANDPNTKKKEQEKAKENVEAKTGYSTEALASVGKKVLNIKDATERKNVADAATNINETSNNDVKDMLSKMTDPKIAEDIVKAGLGSEHLSTGAAGLEASAKAMQETLEANETSKKSMYERLRDSSDMRTFPGLMEKYYGKDSTAPAPQISTREISIEKKTKGLSLETLKNAAKKATADR